MADLTAVFGILILLGLSYPCLLATWQVLFPGSVERAHFRLEHTPGRSFGLGLGAGALAFLLIMILLNLPFGPAKFLGWTVLAGILAIGGLGGAGWARLTGERLLGAQAGDAKQFLTGALVTELAVLFPVIGWFIILPYLLLVTLGAALFAILGWMPAVTKQANPASFGVENATPVPGGQP